VDRYANPEGEVTIGVVGKYVGLPDAYKSLQRGAGAWRPGQPGQGQHPLDRRRIVRAADSDIAARLEPMHGILVPGGFGVRGSEGKIASVRFARERGCRSSASAWACRWPASRGAQHGRDRQRFHRIRRDIEPVVGIITEWMSKEGLQQRSAIGGDLGGTMRLGAYEAKLTGNSHVARASMAPPRSANATATATK
jgi:CTP synthase